MSSDLSFRAVTLPSLSTPGADRVEASARTRGHAAGYAAGLRAAQQQLSQRRAELESEHDALLRESRAAIERSVDLLAAAVRAADSQAIPVLQDAEDTLAAAALDLAEAVLGHELSTGELSARSALDRALGTVPATALTSIRLNPADLESLDADARERASVPLVADPALEPGDAVAVMPDGFLDARIAAALGRARTALLGADS